MSEEKLYAVKNDEGKYWDFEGQDGFFELRFVFCPTTDNEKDAKDVIHGHGGHVVTLVEEPKKVVLSEEQAKIVERAHDYPYPEVYIFDHVDHNDYSSYIEEYLLMNAYVNGYTVAKEKKYNVKVPYAYDSYFYKVDDDRCDAASSLGAGLSDNRSRFTNAEIEHYGLQDCEKEEVTDDDE